MTKTIEERRMFVGGWMDKCDLGSFWFPFYEELLSLVGVAHV